MNDPVTMRRKLRVELKRMRTDQGHTQRWVADELDWSQSKVIRIENGSVAIGVTDLQALLRLYGVADETTTADMVEMAKGSKRQPFSEYRDVHSADTIRYFAYESSASIIRQVEPLLVPGLLQTEEYARALLESYGFARERIDGIWAARAERQELLYRSSPPEAFFVLDEAVVRHQVGGPKVMARQLENLVQLSARPRVTIQILPFSAGASRAMRGPFTYLEFAGDDDPDVLYVEGQLGDSVFRDDPEITGQYLEDFFTLEKEIATGPEDLEKFLSGG